MLPVRPSAAWVAIGLILALNPPAVRAEQDSPARDGILPTDDQGRPLNFDFESGTLADWQAEGEAFAMQPVEGDTVHARRGDMQSDHAGKFWVGTYERHGDEPQGTLTSVPFTVTHPYASFLVAGGTHAETCVEILRAESQQVFFRVSGDETEQLKPVAVDLTRQLGQKIQIRLVDRHSGGWGHINFDDFRWHDTLPAFGTRNVPPPLDVYAHAGLSPADAPGAMTVPEGFSVSLFAGEPDVRQPIAFCLDDRNRLWVAEAYSYPIRLDDDQAHDRILIFEDLDGDGHFDTRKIFHDKLNLVSGLEVGFGGVWVGAAPYLLFIPDRDGDDVPDGAPEPLLDGWAFQDTHETLNAFIWGPDGWLYGCHGVFTHSNVGKPGCGDDERQKLNAGIWRFHPTRHEFEVFAHGTSNPWGVDFNEQGQAFLTACVIPHLFHVIQGARYERQAGQHFNEHTYADIPTIAVHRHWVGDTPHSGNARSDSAGGGHAHAGAMIYLGGTWPEKYHNQIFMNNIHGARINMDALSPDGSGYVGNRADDFLLANDTWSQILNLQYDHAGQVYMIDWYDQNQCHHRETELHDRGNGRVFKVTYQDPSGAGQEKWPAGRDLRNSTDEELITQLQSPREWYARHARRILQERGPNPALREPLSALAFGDAQPERIRLRGLWALHATGQLGENEIALGLTSDQALVRAWTIQLAVETRKPSQATLARFATMAQSDPSPVVRLYLASALDRLPNENRWAVLEHLLAHAEDASDHNLPLMYWYASEPLAAVDASKAWKLVDGSSIETVNEFMLRRIASLGSEQAMQLVVRVLEEASQDADRLRYLQQANNALASKRRVPMPSNWGKLFERLNTSQDPQIRTSAVALALSFGDPIAFDIMRGVLMDEQSQRDVREQAIRALVKAQDPELPPLLHLLVSKPGLRGPAIRALGAYDDPRTPAIVLATYGEYSPDDKRDALGTLSSRREYALALLDAVGEKSVPATDLTAELIRQLRNLKSKEVNARITDVWGAVNETPEERIRSIAKLKSLLTSVPAVAPDVFLGRAMFAKTCQNCHTLFGAGKKVGPELTGSNRANLDYILSNVLDPSALIGRDYQATVISTTGGRILTGLVRGEDQDAVTLITANETLIIPKDEIDERQPSSQSMMPDDLLKPLSEHEIRSLVAYLASPNQVFMLATNDNVLGFFNGKDLEGWDGNAELWTVDQGELVGKSSGLDRNEFLKSNLLLGDFHLRVEVKLVGNAGNSGIQFRSDVLDAGEVRGYQADVGEGWWGKLYEENGRGLLWDRSGEQHVKAGEWNTYEVIAIGSKIMTRINGQTCVELDDPEGARRGILALQLHSGGPTEVRFRGFDLKLNPTPE